jgi:phospholipid/cholesterol/gamma-HCH transport system substrate-binding protein
MPRTRSLAWAELKVGLLTTIAIVIATIAIFMLTGGRGFPWQRYQLMARFSEVPGLAVGSPVRVAGVEVGSVSAMGFDGDQVEVTMQLNRSHQARITTLSVAALGSVSLLGEIADVAEQATNGIEEITALVRDLRAGRGTAGRLMTDDALYDQLQRFVSSAGDLTEGLKNGDGSIGKLLTDPAMADALEASLANVQALTARINAGEGSLGRLMQDDSLVQSLASASANLDELTGRLNRGEGTLGQLLTDDTLMTRLNSVTDQLGQITTRLNNGEGTAGQLLKDERLYENMNAAVNDLRELVADVRKDPRRYMPSSVRISIW